MKTFRSLPLLLLLYLLFIISCQKTDTVIDDNNNGTSSGLNESVMLQLVNAQRQRGCNCGADYYPPTTTVTWNNQLENAAFAHADDMYKNNYFSHTSLSGSSPGDRIRAAGYNWIAYGENIAKGYSSEQAVMDAWVQSPDHCKNIMNPTFKELGAAKVSNYWVQEFGTRF